jgi:hypothetical protein
MDISFLDPDDDIYIRIRSDMFMIGNNVIEGSLLHLWDNCTYISCRVLVLQTLSVPVLNIERAVLSRDNETLSDK